MIGGRKRPTVDFAIVGAANRIMGGALGVVAGENVVVIVDKERIVLGDALVDAARGKNARPALLVLEELGSRPMSAMPEALEEALSHAQASVLLISANSAEVGLRRAVVELVERVRLRHAHLVGLTRRAFVSGFSAEPARVSEMLRAVHLRLINKRLLHYTSAAGSDLKATLGTSARWIERDELIRPGRWVNLPGGELLTLPESVDGRFVALAAQGFAKDNDLRSTPLTVEIEAGRVKSFSCANAELASAAERYVRSIEDLDRVGNLNIGCNPGLLEPIGEAGFDQCVPGLHLVLGFTNPVLTGATWCSKGVVSLTAGGGDIYVDGAALLRNGRYLLTS